MNIAINKDAVRSKGAWIVAAVFFALSAAPWAISGYWLRVLTIVFMSAAMAKAMDFMVGYTGYVPFGNVVFWGLGAYTTGILMARGFPFLPACIYACLLAAVVCVVMGLPLLRLRGHYFAIATIGLNGAILTIALNATALTGGALGLSFPIIDLPPRVVYKYFYFAMFALMVASVLINYLILRTPFGYAVRSIRSNEEAADAIGVNTTLTKIYMWVISAVIFSIAGALYGYWMTYIYTSDVFNLTVSVTAILMVLLGGAGTIFGPIIGAFVFSFSSEIIWSHFLDYHLAILGVIIILVIRFIPGGLYQFLMRDGKKRAERVLWRK